MRVRDAAFGARPRTLHSAMHALVLAVVLTAAPPPPGATAPAAAPAPAPLEVTTLGAEPRTSLAPRPIVGQRERLELIVEGLVNRFLNSEVLLQEKPLPVAYTIDLEVREVREDGAAVLEAVVREAA